MRMSALAAGVAVTSWRAHATTPPDELLSPQTGQSLATPVLRRSLWPQPVQIASVEVLNATGQFLVRVRSRDGATGLAVGHPDVLETTWPILTRRVAPFFVGKDARDLEALLDGVYLANSNYKWQGLEPLRGFATLVTLAEGEAKTLSLTLIRR